MKILTLTGLLIALVGPAAFSSARADRSPVAIRLVGDDELTQKLEVGLRDDLQGNSVLRPATPADQDVVSIESDSNVDWDKLSGRTVVIYTIYVFRGDKRGIPRTGICYESGISKCVDAITRLARIEAERP